MSPLFNVFLDESGDSGWKFDKPYRQGGSSRHLSIAALIAPAEATHFPKRIIREMYKKYDWNQSEEKKGKELSPNQLLFFSEKLLALMRANSDLKIMGITVKKQNVEAHIRNDSNKLYNYMVKLLLSEHLSQCGNVCLYPDERSIKVKSGNSHKDYLILDQWFEKKSSVQIDLCPADSKKFLNIRVVDFLAYIIFSHFEDGADYGFTKLNVLNCMGKTLFFGKPTVPSL